MIASSRAATFAHPYTASSDREQIGTFRKKMMISVDRGGATTIMKPISRRTLLFQLGAVGGALAGGSPCATAGARQSRGPGGEARRLKVIVTGGHPGDPEYGCGGTVARYTDLGHEVTLLYLNEGERPGQARKATRGIRVAEAARACEILKARPLYAGQIDGQAVVDAAHYEAFRKILEGEHPDVVFTHWPIDNHADHRAMSTLVYEAWLRMKKRFTLYYYEVSNGEDTVQFSPTHHVDITDTEPRKRRACYAHASQAPDRFYALQEQVTRLRGIESGHRQAEAFIRHIQSPDFALPLAFS
jgi:LmbE family N-acetylglucosaminyl deacetylase